MKHQLSAFTFVAMGMILGVFWGGGCGGSGGNSTASPIQSSTPQVHMHVSTPKGPTAIGAGVVDAEIASVTFTPASGNDLLLYVLVEGTATSGAALDNAYFLEIRDVGGNRIRRIRNSSSFFATGAGQPFRMMVALPMEWDHELGATRPPCDLDFIYPSSSYTIRFSISSDTSWSGSFDSVVFKIFTLEGVTVDSPSTRIS